MSLVARLPARPYVLDGTLGAVLLAIGLVEFAVTGVPDGAATPAVTYTLLVLHTVPLAWRRRWPLAVMIVIGTAGTLAPVLHAPQPFTGVFAILVALYTVAAHGERAEAVVSAGVTAVALVIVAVSLREELGFAGIVANYVLFGTAWMVGDSVRHRRAYVGALEARTAVLEREREERAARAAVEERARIARELHDVVAHTVSVMVVQAGAARRVAERDPPRAREAVAAIEATGRQALGELRRLLGVLREDGDVDALLAPQPGLAAVPELVAQLREAGLDIELDVRGVPSRLPAGVELAAYRVVQEALTNTVKHAGPARAHVTVDHGPDALTVEVQDDGRGASATAASGGHGLLGMRERVALYGGTLEAGPRPGGGYRVRARLPRGGDPSGQGQLEGSAT